MSFQPSENDPFDPWAAPRQPIYAIPIAPEKRLRAIPLAPTDVHFDFDESDLPLAEPYDDFDYSPRRRRRKRKPKKPSRLVPLFIGYGSLLALLILSLVFNVCVLLAQGDAATK